MILWIDAAGPSGPRVFGMTMVERHLQAVRHQRIRLSEIVIDIGSSGNRPTFRSDERLKCPIRIVETAGSTADRLRAALAKAGDEPIIATTSATLADARLYAYLASQTGSRRAGDGVAILARIEPKDIASIESAAIDLASALGRLHAVTQDEFPAFIRKLRRSLPYYLFAVDSESKQREVEKFLFWSNYKGSTDFFTKYVYPPLVWLMVPPLARARVHPNWVTLVSILLTLLVIPLCATGHFWWGFACAYGMSVLDSVDGKLARLTFTDSWLGNILDHGLDLIHPPFWYMAWAWGLSGGDTSSPVWIASLWMLGLYVLDRLILKVYPGRFQKGLHTHAPIDSVMRTFISRRNINLPLFTIGYAIGFGTETIYLIVLWQILTCIYHGLRTAWILWVEKASPAAEG
jgi:phosphatidylglycerophosphate synthase